MKKILCMLLALLLLASLGTVAFADGWQEVYEENGFTLTFTDAFRTENLKGIFSARAAGKIDDGLYYAEFLYMGISEEELSVILEKEEDEISEADKALIRSKQGTLAVVYGIDYTKISEENLAIQKSIADRVTELATAGDVVFYRYNSWSVTSSALKPRTSMATPSGVRTSSRSMRSPWSTSGLPGVTTASMRWPRSVRWPTASPRRTSR